MYQTNFLLWVTPDFTTTNMAARNAGKEILSSNSSFHEAESMKMHCVMNDVVVMIMITYEITRSQRITLINQPSKFEQMLWVTTNV